MDGFAGYKKAFETLKNVLDEYKIKVIMIPPHSSLWTFSVSIFKKTKLQNTFLINIILCNQIQYWP